MAIPTHLIQTRPPRGGPASASVLGDPDVIRGFQEDAAHVPDGHASGVALPRTEAEVADLVRTCPRLLAVGAQSSLTGGATPMGEVVLSTSRLRAFRISGEEHVYAEAGVVLSDLQETLARRGLFFPPVPTFEGATVGGVVATNAAGAATFKYGTTRDWVEGLTVVLSSGDVLDVRRGAVLAHPAGYFEIEDSTGRRRVPIPSYRMPRVAKCSAGYYAAPGMDVVDLFVGSEGTLGVITEVVLRVAPRPPASCLFFATMKREPDALALTAALRRASLDTWRSGDPRGLDVAAIESLDRRCLELLIEDGVLDQDRIGMPPDSQVALLIRLELPAALTSRAVYGAIESALAPDAPDTPLVRLCRLFDEADLLDRVEVAGPDDRRMMDRLTTLREAVPTAINQRIARAQRNLDPRIEKVAADMIVPFEHLHEMLGTYRAAFERRGLDYAIWGHLSDGNLHPNLIPRATPDLEAGREAVLECGQEVIRLGGSPLAEHGVGRNRVKQALLHQLYGDRGIEQMRAVRDALDTRRALSPGVLFPFDP